ncbi:MAG TPA: restriction endonuclease [Nonomuraea sp.]|nr:restriction endonuclease [Nonomuraea sp.]
MLAKLDDNALVQRDILIPGSLSGEPRQVDVLITGSISGQEISIAVECKHYKKKLGIGMVDEFAGKLQDLNVEQGLLFALNGFTRPAQERAKGARVPKIILSSLVPHDHTPVDFDSLFTGYGDCPNVNCYTGDIAWYIWVADTEDGGSDTLAFGKCDTCGSQALRCSECGEIVDFFWNESACESCGTGYSLIEDRKGIDVEEIKRSIDGTTATFTPDFSQGPTYY